MSAVAALAVTGIFAIVIAEWWTPASMVVGAVLVPLAIAAWIDHDRGVLPDALLAAAFLPVLMLIASMVADGALSGITPIVLGGLVTGAPVLMVHLVSPAAMGFGDVKALAVLGAALGSVHWSLGLVGLSVAAALGASYGLLHRKRRIAFGPWILLGGGCALVVARVGSLGWAS